MLPWRRKINKCGRQKIALIAKAVFESVLTAATVVSTMSLPEWKELVPPLVCTGVSLLQSVEQDLFTPEEELTFMNCKQSLTEICTCGLVSSRRFCHCWSSGKCIGKLPLAKAAKFCPSWPCISASPFAERNLKSHLTACEGCC